MCMAFFNKFILPINFLNVSGWSNNSEERTGQWHTGTKLFVSYDLGVIVGSHA